MYSLYLTRLQLDQVTLAFTTHSSSPHSNSTIDKVQLFLNQINFVRFEAVIVRFAKYGHLSSVVVVKLDGFVLPALDCCRNRIPIKNLFKEGSIQDFLIGFDQSSVPSCIDAGLPNQQVPFSVQLFCHPPSLPQHF